MSNTAWISICVGIVGLAVSITTFFIGRFSAHRQEGEKSGYLASDIGYIKAGIDDLKTEIRTLKVELAEVNTRVTRAEERLHSAFVRIENIEKSLAN